MKMIFRVLLLVVLKIGDNEAKLVTLKKIAEGFGWSLSELFERIEEKLPNNFKIFDDEHY